MPIAFALVCALLATTPLQAQSPQKLDPFYLPPLSFDPFYVLPAGPGQASIDAGINASDTGNLFNTSNAMAMAKFNPHEKIEAGAQLAFGWLNDATNNFTHLVVGAKYSLGKRRAATANLAVPAGNVKNPGISLGIMQTLGLASSLEISSRLQFGLLKGYTDGKGIIIDAFIEPVYLVNDRLSAYLTTTLTSNSDGFSNALGVNLNPNIDIGIGDGLVVNLGLTFGAAGNGKLAQTALGIFFLRVM